MLSPHLIAITIFWQNTVSSRDRRLFDAAERLRAYAVFLGDDSPCGWWRAVARCTVPSDSAGVIAHRAAMLTADRFALEVAS